MPFYWNKKIRNAHPPSFEYVLQNLLVHQAHRHWRRTWLLSMFGQPLLASQNLSFTVVATLMLASHRYRWSHSNYIESETQLYDDFGPPPLGLIRHSLVQGTEHRQSTVLHAEMFQCVPMREWAWHHWPHDEEREREKGLLTWDECIVFTFERTTHFGGTKCN